MHGIAFGFCMWNYVLSICRDQAWWSTSCGHDASRGGRLKTPRRCRRMKHQTSSSHWRFQGNHMTASRSNCWKLQKQRRRHKRIHQSTPMSSAVAGTMCASLDALQLTSMIWLDLQFETKSGKSKCGRSWSLVQKEIANAASWQWSLHLQQFEIRVESKCSRSWSHYPERDCQC